MSIALDVEAIRRSLGLPKPSLLAFSYGTWVATTYAILFPQVVTATVLDGAYPLADEPTNSASNAISSVLARRCARIKSCSTRKVREQIKKIVADVRKKPQALPGSADGFDEAVLASVVQAYLNTYDPKFFQAIANAAEGNYKELLALAPPALALAPGEPLNDSFALGAAVVCNDYPFPYRVSDDASKRAVDLKNAIAGAPPESFGLFRPGAWISSVSEIDACVSWPNTKVLSQLQLPRFGPYPSSPVLVVNGDVDLQTPIEGAQVAAAHFPNSVLITVVNAGHAVIPVSECAQNATVAFLTTFALPKADMCVDSPLPNP